MLLRWEREIVNLAFQRLWNPYKTQLWHLSLYEATHILFPTQGALGERKQYWNTRQLQMQYAASLVCTPQWSSALGTPCRSMIPLSYHSQHKTSEDATHANFRWTASQHQTFLFLKFHSMDLTWRNWKEGGNGFKSLDYARAAKRI